jgi:hypothetical protein
MTLIELFPWLLAICVTMLSAALLRQSGLSDFWALSIGLIWGIGSWVLFVFGGKRFLSWLERKKIESEKSERTSRAYQVFDATKEFPSGRNLFYECLVCGNVVPSLPKKNIGCKCRNIMIDADSRRLEIRDRTKVKLFSHVTA